MSETQADRLPPPPAPGRRRAKAAQIATLFIPVTVLLFFVIRTTGYPLLGRHDVRVSSYVLDAVQNGNWIIQKDYGGEIAAKPPLLTWCAAVTTLLTGRISRVAIHLPAAVALCATALALLAGGRSRFGERAGFLAAMIYVVSPAGYSQLATARYDGLLAFMVVLSAFAAFRAWHCGSGWIWFWLAAAAGTLVKGPLAVLLGGAGLLAYFWEWRTGSRLPLRGNHFPGLLLFLLICGGWFLLAYAQLGQPLINKMIGRELIGAAVGAEDGPSPWGPLKPPRDFLITFAPWSFACLYSFWRIWKRPDADPTRRRFERFLASSLLAGIIVFSAGGHRQSRLIVPLLPLAALLAGRELATLLALWSDRKLFRLAAVLAVGMGIGIFIHGHFLMRRSPRVTETSAARQTARLIREQLGPEAPLTYVDSPFAVQFYLNDVRPAASFERAAALLRGGAGALVVVRDVDRLRKQMGPDADRLHEILRLPPTGEPWIQVLGNQPQPLTNQPVALLLGPLRVELDSLRLQRLRINYRHGIDLFVHGNPAPGKLRVENQSASPQWVRLRLIEAKSGRVITETKRSLAPGTVWDFPQDRPLALGKGAGPFTLARGPDSRPPAPAISPAGP